MAIESAALLRRFARTESLAALLVFVVVSLSGLAAAQAPTVPAVMSGSVIPINHPQTGQIYSIVFASTGDMVFLDTSNGGLYQMKPDGKTFVTISAPDTVLKGAGSFWNAGMAIDSNNTLYITDRWGGYVMYRVPYDAGTGTWAISAANADWIKTADLKSSCDVLIDPIDGSLIFSRENPDFSIMRLPLNADGSPGTASYILKGLKGRAAKMAIDPSGNVFFVEEPWTGRANVVEGVFMVPRGTQITNGDGQGSLEAQLPRVDPLPSVGDFNGVSTDHNGNLYLTQQVNTQWNEMYNMVVMVPNEGGTLNRNHAKMIAPVSASANLTIDPRGYLWIPVGTNGWDGIPGTYNFVKWSLGSAEVPAAAVGATGTDTVNVYYAFNADTTPASFAFVAAGGGSDFAIEPNSPPAANECAVGTTYHQWGGCYVRVALKPRVPGDVSGQLQMLDASNHVLATTQVHGVGLAPGLAALVPAAESEIGSSLTGQKQIAADVQGNIYVADSTSGRVLKYPAGSGTSGTPVSIGTSLSAPSGVAVDANGNVYIADPGKILKVPYQSGSYGAQSTIQTGLGADVKLAADGAGNVYAADSANSRILKVLNSQTAVVMSGHTAVVIPSGVTTPSALASDAAGNLVVADSNNSSLVLLPVNGGKVAIANGFASVNGLAVDASGSVYVSQDDGLRRIPSVPGGGYSTNDTIQLAPNTVTSPTGVAVDPAGNVYASQGVSVTQLSFNGAVNFNEFGAVLPNMQTPAEVQLFNIGNLPLTFAAFAQDPITDPDQFETIAADDSPNCDPTIPTLAGAFCWLGVGMTANGDGARSATLTINSDAANAAPITVTLAGNAVADTRPATKLTITTAPDQPVYPANVTVTVTASLVSGSGTPTGNVTLAVSGKPKVTAPLVDGVATFAYPNLNGGTYKVRASYGGDGDSFGASGSPGQFVVNRAASTNAVAVQFNYLNFVRIGSDFVLTATVTSSVPGSIPTGKVRFVEGADQHLADPAQPFATLDANGHATFNTNNLNLPAGIPKGTASTHVITAVYDGDTNFAPASAAPVTLQIVNPSVYVDTTGATFNITPGTPQTVALTLRSLEGYTNTVNLLCANLPQYSECTFDNPTVIVNQDPPILKPVKVTISTNVPVNAGAGMAGNHLDGSPWLFASMFGLGLVGLLIGKKTKCNGRALVVICAVLLVAGAVAGMAACANGGYTKTPPAPHVKTPVGNYTVSIIAIDKDDRVNVAIPNTFPVTVQAQPQ